MVIASGLEESAANRVILALEQSGVSAHKNRDELGESGYQVTVTEGDTARAIGVLARQGLPPPRSPGVLEALGSGSLVPSRAAEQARVLVGTAGDLQRSIGELDGVVSARVHLAVPEPDPLGDRSLPVTASASVLVRHRGETPAIAAPELQKLVAGAVPNLAPTNVEVILSRAAAAPPAEGSELSRFGPITATRSSLFPLRLLIGGIVALNLVLLGLVLVLWRRLRHTPARTRDLKAGDGETI